MHAAQIDLQCITNKQQKNNNIQDFDNPTLSKMKKITETETNQNNYFPAQCLNTDRNDDTEALHLDCKLGGIFNSIQQLGTCVNGSDSSTGFKDGLAATAKEDTVESLYIHCIQYYIQYRVLIQSFGILREKDRGKKTNLLN